MRSWGWLVLVALAACGGKSQTDAAAAQCTIGASVACTCVDGRTGAQICQADDTLGACTCTGGTGTGGSDAGRDAAGTGGQVKVDAARDDVGSEPDGSCWPVLPGGWQPTWRPPRGPQPTACTLGQIDTYLGVCWRQYDRAACDAFWNASTNDPCLACMLGSDDDPAYGPVVMGTLSWFVNLPGCMALEDGDTSAAGCGAKTQAADQCGRDSCHASCASSTFDAYETCQTQARTTVCQPYEPDPVCRYASKYYRCYPPQDAPFEDWARLYAVQFCSQTPDGGPGDAGADGSKDGAGADADACAPGPAEQITAEACGYNPGTTANAYSGIVTLTVTGLFANTPGAPLEDGFYQVEAGNTSVAVGACPGCLRYTRFSEATCVCSQECAAASHSVSDILVGTYPPFSPSHEYTVQVDLGTAPPEQIRFGMADCGCSDNSGTHTITIAAEPCAP